MGRSGLRRDVEHPYQFAKSSPVSYSDSNGRIPDMVEGGGPLLPAQVFICYRNIRGDSRWYDCCLPPHKFIKLEFNNGMAVRWGKGPTHTGPDPLGPNEEEHCTLIDVDPVCVFRNLQEELGEDMFWKSIDNKIEYRMLDPNRNCYGWTTQMVLNCPSPGPCPDGLPCGSL